MKKIGLYILAVSIALSIFCGNLNVFAENKPISDNLEVKNESIDEADIIDLLDFLNKYSDIINEGYDYKFTDYNYVTETAAKLVLELNDDNYVKEIKNEVPAPLNELSFYSRESYYYEINGNIMDWYIKNVFHKEPDHNYIGKENFDDKEYIRNYYYNEKYYFTPVFRSYDCDKWGFFEDISCQRLNDGRYYIKFIDKETGNVKKYILAERIEKEDKKYWGFYNISDNPILLAAYNLEENSYPVNFQLSGDRVKLRVNGNEINIEDKENMPVVYGGNIYIPVCAVADILNVGVTSKWGPYLTAIISTDNYICENRPGSCWLYIDNNSILYPHSSHTIDDKYLMPVEMFFTALGGMDGSYEWNKEENYVNIIVPDFSVNEKLTEIKAKYKAAEEKGNYIEESFMFGGELYGTVYKNSATKMIEKIHINEDFSRYSSKEIDLYFENNKIYYYYEKSSDYTTGSGSEIKCYFDDGKIIRYEGDVLEVWDESLKPENYEGYFNCFRPATAEEKEDIVFGDISEYWKLIFGSEYER